MNVQCLVYLPVTRRCMGLKVRDILNFVSTVILGIASGASWAQQSTLEAVEKEATSSFKITLSCGSTPPGDGSELARLFEFAEANVGLKTKVSLDFDSSRCACPSRQTGAAHLLEKVCSHNPDWPLAEKMRRYHCVQALGLAGYGAGVGSFCFPTPGLLSRQAGYSSHATGSRETLSGDFQLAWEWSLGAPHVQLLLPD